MRPLFLDTVGHVSHNAGMSATSIAAGSKRAWLLALGYFAGFLLLDWVSYIRPMHGLNITPWNPQSALAIALLIWNRRWLWLVWAALAAAELLVRGIPANGLPVFGVTVALGLTYAAVARVIVNGIDLSHPFATRRDLGIFALIIALGSLATACVYVLVYSTTGLGGGGSVPGAIARYWIGDAVGLVVALPMLMMLLDRPRRATLVSTLRNGAWWLSAGMTGLGLWIVFGRGEQDYFKFFYLLLLPVVWAAAQFGVAGAVLSSVLTQLGLIAAAQFALQQDGTVFELQALMAASAITAMLVGVLVDERSHAAADLRSSLRFAAAGQMAAALAHELSQPLTALSNYARACRSLAEDSGEFGSRQRDQISDVMRRVGNEAQRAGDIVKRLRDFFKSGSTSLQRVRVDGLLREAADAHVPVADKLGVALHLEIARELPAVWIDPLQVAVVLRNLIANAIESASTAAERQVTVSAVPERQRVLIAVQDSGPGVHPARLQTLFDGLPSNKPGGLGVGLSICRAIIEAHGGKLWAEAGPQGRFFFTLPTDETDHAS
jgi:two-component system, LuxR family, sensor kinase FixL